MRGLFHLAWLELKIFLREPMGAFGTLAVPALVFFGANLAGTSVSPRFASSEFARSGLPVLAATFMAISAVLSLMTIIAVYREGGILKRLRATPLRPLTILMAHVLVKLVLTAATLLVLTLAGRRFVALPAGVSMLSFGAALLYATACLLSLGFLLASFVPTARFAQPMGALVLYPMVGLSGLFVPVEAFPETLQRVAHALPFTHAVSLMQGIWMGHLWSAHLTDVAALFATAVVCSVLAGRVFRWE